MKPAFVSLLFVVAACELPTEPQAPPLPRVPDENGPVVIVGRVVYGPNGVGLQAANVRVIEAGVSVGTDEAGRYRVVLPAQFRGRVIPLNFRAIGFDAQTQIVAITSDTMRVHLAMSVSMLRLGCMMGIPDSAVNR